MEMESAALVKTCEDILSLSRQLKELWLFGKLDTLRQGGSGGEEKVEEDARAVKQMVEDLLRRSSGGGSGVGNTSMNDDQDLVMESA